MAPHSNPNKPVCNRFYSIASSGKVSPTSIAICGVVVEYKIPDGRSNYGVATTWLRWAEWSALKCFCLISSSGRSCLLGRARRGFAQRFPPMSGGHSSDCPTELRWGKLLHFYFQLCLQTPVIMIGPGTGLAPFRGFIQVCLLFIFGGYVDIVRTCAFRSALGRRRTVRQLDRPFFSSAAGTRTRTTSTGWSKRLIAENLVTFFFLLSDYILLLLLSC